MGIANTVRKFSPSLYRLRILTIITAVLVLPLILSYLLFVRSQAAYFTDRSFRSLSLISSHIASKVESAGLVLKNGSEKFINPKVQTDSAKFNPDPNHTQENLDGIKEIFKGLKDDSPEIVPISIESKVAGGQASAATVTLTDVRQEAEDSPWLYLTYVSEPTSLKTVVTVQAKADLNSLVQPLLSRPDNIGDSDRDQFQNILIADAGTGRVIYQLDNTEVRMASLDKLIALKDIGQTSNVVDVAVAGSNYKLFFHPLELSLPSSSVNANNTAWIIAGFIGSEYFRNESWSISYTILIVCGFVTVLLILSWPFLKLILIGSKDRLKTADVYFLTFSTVVVLAVLTCFGFYGYGYWKVEDALNSQLEHLASDVKKHFNVEVTQALQQLDLLSRNRNLLLQLESPTPCEKTADVKIDIYQQRCTDKEEILPELLRSRDTKYPYFDTAVWLDEAGMQRAKWTIKENTTQYINVSGRAYFRNIRQGNFHELPGHRFWLEPIISKTTGRNEVEISQLAADPKWIAAFDTRLLSLMQPVLPAGFGFLIIENDGKVLFHSDETHHLGENFIQECDYDPELRSAVVGRTNMSLNVQYLGEGHRLFITAVDGFPEWSLVVFRNKQTLRSAFLELLSLVSLLFLIHSLILLTCFTSFYLTNFGNERRAWLWPANKKTAIYYQSFFLLLVLSGISGFLIIFLDGQKLVWIIAGIGLLGAFTFFLNLRFGDARLWPSRWKNLSDSTTHFWRHDVAYVLNLAFLLLLVAVFPAAAFFKYAYESEMKLLVKHGQFTLAAALSKRDERIRSQYSHIVTHGSPTSAQTETTTEPGTSPFIRQRLSVDWDVYDRFFFDTHRENPSGGLSTCPQDSSGDLLSGLNRLLPLYNQTSIERRGLLANSNANGVCKWEPAGNGRLVLHLDTNSVREAAWPWRHLNTKVPVLGIPGVPWLGVFMFSFTVFLLFLRFIVRKVFLLDVYRPTSYSLKVLLSKKIERNTFIVLDRPFTEGRAYDTSDFHLIDVRSIANSPDWAVKFDYDMLSNVVGPIALDNFDYKIDDAQTNQQKLVFVENLLNRGRIVIIFSALEPSEYYVGDTGKENGGRDEAWRWAGLMSQFFKKYAEDSGDRHGFAKAVVKEKRRILAMDLEGRSREEIIKLINMLYAECAPKEPLQHIGLHILREGSFIRLTPDHLLNRIVNQARTYYNDIWNTCSIGEKLTLFHLAQDHLLSHRDPDIERLLRSELIARDSDVHLMNDSFRQFVKLTEQTAFVAEHEEKAKQGSLWQTLKVPLLVVLVAISIFLFVTQRDIYTSSLAIVTAVTTIIPSFFKVLSLFQTDPIGRAPSQN